MKKSNTIISLKGVGTLIILITILATLILGKWNNGYYLSLFFGIIAHSIAFVAMDESYKTSLKAEIYALLYVTAMSIFGAIMGSLIFVSFIFIKYLKSESGIETITLWDAVNLLTFFIICTFIFMAYLLSPRKYINFFDDMNERWIRLIDPNKISVENSWLNELNRLGILDKSTHTEVFRSSNYIFSSAVMAFGGSSIYLKNELSEINLIETKSWLSKAEGKLTYDYSQEKQKIIINADINQDQIKNLYSAALSSKPTIITFSGNIVNAQELGLKELNQSIFIEDCAIVVVAI